MTSNHLKTLLKVKTVIIENNKKSEKVNEEKIVNKIKNYLNEV